MLYVSYGSNMDRLQMEQRCPGAVCLGKCEIMNHSLEFRLYANIKYKKGGRVPATAWVINEKHKKSLDSYEGVHRGLYKHKKVKVKINGEIVIMVAYIMPPGARARQTPSIYYLDTIYRGYVQAGHDTSRLEKQALKI